MDTYSDQQVASIDTLISCRDIDDVDDDWKEKQ